MWEPPRSSTDETCKRCRARTAWGEDWICNECRKICGPDVASWFTRGRWPRCACGFSPRDNTVLTKHWVDAGFKVVDNHGHLEKRDINKGEGNAEVS